MLTRDKLVNILAFMERAQAHGKECLAWSQTYEAVEAEIKLIDTPKKRKPHPEDAGDIS